MPGLCVGGTRCLQSTIAEIECLHLPNTRIHRDSRANFRLSTHDFRLTLKKQQTNQHRSNNTDQIYQQHGAEGVAGVLDFYTAEVDGYDVEGGFGAALEDAGEAAGEGVYTVGLHGIYHKAAGAAGTEGAQQGHGDGIYYVAVYMQHQEESGDEVGENLEDPAVSEQGDGYQHTQDVGEYGDACFKAATCPLYKGGEDVLAISDKYFFMPESIYQNQEDDRQEDDIGYIVGKVVFGDEVEVHNVEHEPGEQAYYSSYGEEQRSAPEIDSLTDTYYYHGSERANKRGDNAGQHHIGRVVAVLCGPVAYDGSGYEGEPGGMQAKKHDLRIAGPFLVFVELLQALHGFETEGGGGGVEAEEVGGEVEGHVGN